MQSMATSTVITQSSAEIQTEVPPKIRPSAVRKRQLTAEYNLESRARQFLKLYPALRGQYSMELVQATPFLMQDERDSLTADYSAVFKALRWPQFAYCSHPEQLVPDCRSPFRDQVTFCWYAYSPFSRAGSRMRALYQNILFRDCATWYMTNKMGMLRRLLLAEATRKAAIDSGLAEPPRDPALALMSSRWFIPPSRVHSRGSEAATAAWMQQQQQQDAVSIRFLVKPAAGLRGRGIQLYSPPPAQGDAGDRAARSFNEFMQRQYGETTGSSAFYVVQRYIQRPMLIRGRKFDMRIFVLVVPNMTCSLKCDTNPGRRGFYAFYHPGFARLSSVEYADGSSTDLRVHLTNTSVQRAGSTRCSLNEINLTPDQLNEYFNERFELGLDGIPCRDWFRVTAQSNMHAIMAYVISQFARFLVGGASYNSFKLLGCDIMFDVDGRAWLLEMNSLPALTVRTPCHRAVKSPMQREALALAVEVAHRSANGLPVTSCCLAMRQNFRLIYSPTNPKVQGKLVRAFSQRMAAEWAEGAK